MNDILKAHSSAWLNAKAYRLAWLLGPIALATLIFGLQFWITPSNNLRILQIPLSYTQEEAEKIAEALKRKDPAVLQALRNAAEDDDLRALEYMGRLHDPNGPYRGMVPPNADTALAYFERAAALGSVDALMNAGRVLARVTYSDKACSYFERAFKADPTRDDARGEAGYCLATTPNVSATEKARGFEMMESAAASGFVRAYGLLGFTYLHQSPPDFNQAIGNFEKAIAGNVDDSGHSYNELGHSYFYGNGVTQDYKKAIALYLEGAKRGSTGSALNLSFIYTEGKYGTPVNYEKALEYALLSARGGNAAGHYNTFLAYFRGRGTPRDYGLAAQHCLNAISLGNEEIFEFVKMENKTVPFEFIRALKSRLSKAVIYTGSIDGKINPELLKSMRSLLNKRQLFE